ncbi:MAG: hypothetical protein JW845_06345 [Dehalococcoidales bacterium]|nr:hypothetical protein [Dehalococcoidales bacterium]
MRKGLQQRLVRDYSYAVDKMQHEAQLQKKLFYFSIFFSEAQRTLNFEWNTDLALIYTVTHHVHTQINAAMQTASPPVLPIDWQTIFDKLTIVSSNLASYLNKKHSEAGKEDLCLILGHFAEIAYAVSGNGSYLYEKGSFKL